MNAFSCAMFAKDNYTEVDSSIKEVQSLWKLCYIRICYDRFANPNFSHSILTKRNRTVLLKLCQSLEHFLDLTKLHFSGLSFHLLIFIETDKFD